MRILAFETSAKAASVAILEEDKLLGESYLNCGQTHSRTLMKLAEDLLAVCELTAKDITAVACAAGPGSFTGVRIGTAAAKGFAWGRELPCVGVSTLEAMAQQARLFEGIVCCAMDARREQVYNALFSCEGGNLTRLTEDRAISLEELAQALKNEKKPKIMVGDGAHLCYNTIGKDLSGCILAPEHIVMQRASGVALAARQLLLSGADFDGAALVPNYLRLSQAERERNERLQKSKGEA
ncbi:MAG: tRNA (adenosine(37)-N6)-threonylcarbamoyltransferase complex dimerization subunit type 1 TsaB [Faecousia sp.]